MFFLVCTFDLELGLISKEVMSALNPFELFQQVEVLLTILHLKVK